MFWAFAAFCALLIDRDHSRALLARKVAAVQGWRIARYPRDAAALA